VSLSVIRQLFVYHDKDHLIFKRISAGDDPTAFHNSAKLLSFHGFVRYQPPGRTSINFLIFLGWRNHLNRETSIKLL